MKRGLKALKVTPDETELMCLNEKRIERGRELTGDCRGWQLASMKRGLKVKYLNSDSANPQSCLNEKRIERDHSVICFPTNFVLPQ